MAASAEFNLCFEGFWLACSCTSVGHSRRLAELRDLEALSFAVGLASGPKWRGRKPKASERLLRDSGSIAQLGN